MPSGIKMSEEEFIYKLKSVSPELNLISKFVNFKIKVRVKDLLGITYMCRPQDLLLGKKPTLIVAENRNEAFIIKVKTVHGDKYLYDKIDYKTARIHVLIGCRIHGYWKVTPDAVLSQNQGCPECGKLKSIESRAGHPRGWSPKSWEASAKISDIFDGFKLYIIKCYSEDEEFIKVGRTYVKLKIRFEDRNKMPYKWEVLYLYKGSAEYIFKLENLIKSWFNSYLYKPKKRFPGEFECFKDVPNLDTVMLKIKNEGEGISEDFYLGENYLNDRQKHFLQYLKESGKYMKPCMLDKKYCEEIIKRPYKQNSYGSRVCQKLLKLGLVTTSYGKTYKAI
jgi:hypothetical protein